MIGDTIRIEVWLFENGMAVTRIFNGIVASEPNNEECDDIGLKGNFFSVISKNHKITFATPESIIGSRRLVLIEKTYLK